MSRHMTGNLVETGAGGFRCRGWAGPDGAHHACQTRTMPQHWDGQCHPCSQQEALAQREQAAGVGVGRDEVGATPATAPILRVNVQATARQWHRDYAACRGWGADREGAHHACTHRDADHFDAGRCWYCHTEHNRWLARGGQEAASPAEAPELLPVDPAPAVAVPTVAVPTVVEPRGWSLHYDWCVNCGCDDRKPASLGLCVACYPLSTQRRYQGRKGPNLLGIRDRVEQRRMVDAYLATIERPVLASMPAWRQSTPAPAASPAPPVALVEPAVEPVAALVTAARETVRVDPAQTVTPRWVVFDGAPAVPTQEPWLSWQRGGLVAFPAVTLALLGSPTHVRLLWDAELRLLGVEAATAATAHARQLPSPENGRGSVSLSVRALIKRFGLAGVRPGRYRVQQYGAVVAIQLPEAVEAGT